MDWLCWKIGIGWRWSTSYFCNGGYEEQWIRKSDGQVRVIRFSEGGGKQWRVMGHDRTKQP